MTQQNLFRRYLVAAFGFVLILGTMGIGSTNTSSNAPPQQPEKIKEVPKLGVFALPDAPGEKGQVGIAGLLCDTQTVCQFPDPMFTCARQPATGFEVVEEQKVHIEADVFDGHDCVDFVGTSMGDLTLPPGRVTVFLRFDPPLERGTPLSMIWRTGSCPETKCVNFTMGSADQPPTCSQL